MGGMLSMSMNDAAARMLSVASGLEGLTPVDGLAAGPHRVGVR